MAQNSEKKGNLTVVAIDVEKGKITRVKGVEQANVAQMNEALDKLGFDAYEERDAVAIETALSKPTDSTVLILHTHSSPGCEWVYQDGRWRKVCN